MKKILSLLMLTVLTVLSATSQINYSANDFGHLPPNTSFFQYGANMGYYGPSWDDKTLADIAAGNPAKNVKGAGVKSLHLPLPESFLESWAYDVRVDMFNHYASLGIKDNTVFLEDPKAEHRDPTNFGCSQSSRLFKNMYEPIWDGGANGTPVNDNNYLALYIYKTVTTYKQYVKYWEIINEPDLEYGTLGDGDPGVPGNWWDNNPPPCSIPNLYAPIFQYIRALRIGYEVVKYVDPTAYVSPGGLGKPAFLDAILRNSDNPADGSVNANYPQKGGAYFDALSIHMYPIYHLHQWDNSIFGFAFSRHSDAAVTKYIEHKNKFFNTLAARGYNGTTYPTKHIITTENNIPNKSVQGSIGPWIGSQEAQRNYDIKALVESQKNGIDQFYIFVLGNDKETYDPTASELSFLGLYQNLNGKGPLTNGGVYGQQYNESGIAYKTTSDLLLGKRYDATRTAAMALPSNVGGAAFKDDAGNYVYVLWAKTTIDMSETASATYSFPGGLVLAQLTKKDWNFSSTNTSSSIASTNIALTGAPIFLSGTGNPQPAPPPVIGCDSVTITAASGGINFTGLSAQIVTVQVFKSSWASAYNQTFTNSPGTLNIPSLSAGVYHAKVSFYTSSWSPVCDKSQDVTVQVNTPPPPPPPPPPPGGTPNCNNIGIVGGSGSINLSGLTAPVVAIQVFNNSWASVYNQTFTNSPGTQTIPSLSVGTYHVKVTFYTSSWSLICDKSQDAVVQSSTPGGGTPNCNTITISPVAGGLTLSGLTAPVISLQVFNNSWATIYNQTFTNSPGSVTIPSLSNGTYHVKVNFASASWSPICEKFVDAVVGSAGVANGGSVNAVEVTPKQAEQANLATISAAPNPFVNTIQVTINSTKDENATLVMFDAIGREVYRKPISLRMGSNRFTLDGSKYVQGNYFLKLLTKQNTQTIKLLRQ